MLKYNITDFKRDINARKYIKRVGDSFLATADLYIFFPVNYVDKKLSIIDTTCKLYGVVLISDTNLKYMVMTIPTQFNCTPDSMELVDINGIEYYRLSVLKNDLLVDDTNVVVLGDMGYYTFDIFLRKGKIPFFIEYFDLLKVFLNLTKYTHNNVNDYEIVLKILIKIVARSYGNKDIPYVQTLNTIDDIDKKRVEWIAMSNIYYSYSSTLSKIGGSYMKDGMLSAIVKPEKEATILESVVRR